MGIVVENVGLNAARADCSEYSCICGFSRALCRSMLLSIARAIACSSVSGTTVTPGSTGGIARPTSYRSCGDVCGSATGC